MQAIETPSKDDLNAQRRAIQLLTSHDHGGPFQDKDDENLCRANCGACVLGGYQNKDNKEHHVQNGPNYAGWARVYVQAQQPVPTRWLRAFNRELARTDNPAYVEGLRHDLAVFGDPR